MEDSNTEARTATWVRLCGAQEAPGPGEVIEASAANLVLCVANVNGRLAAVDNVCPHRQGPLGGGWLEGDAVVCPWHAWAFSTATGAALPPERAQIKVFRLKVEGDDILVNIS